MIIQIDRFSFFFLTLGVLLSLIPLTMTLAMGRERNTREGEIIQLPSPALKGSVSVEETINSRRTIRSFANKPLTLGEWGQILWAAQGITSDGGIKKRAAPSAGALYPLDIYLILGKSVPESLGAGLFHYLPLKHALRRISAKDFTKKVAEASLHQYWMAEAPGMVLITAEYSRITGKYGDRGIRYAHIEAGHVAQNCFLQAESLTLNVGIVGAFDDKALIDLLPIPRGFEPILLLPIGRSE